MYMFRQEGLEVLKGLVLYFFGSGKSPKGFSTEQAKSEERRRSANNQVKDDWATPSRGDERALWRLIAKN